MLYRDNFAERSPRWRHFERGDGYPSHSAIHFPG